MKLVSTNATISGYLLWLQGRAVDLLIIATYSKCCHIRKQSPDDGRDTMRVRLEQ